MVNIGTAKQACDVNTAVGTLVVAGIIIFLWVLVDVILSILWLVRGRKVGPVPGAEPPSRIA